MQSKRKSLFKLIVEISKQHSKFKALWTKRANLPARWMLNEVYQSFEDVDGNFLEQFQTTGFNSRYFELYLHAYFTRSGFSLDRSRPYPDFIVSRHDLRVAVEATTVNPSTSGALSKFGTKIPELAPNELASYAADELAIRFGSPLVSKLSKRYWELDHCRGLPFVIAIEAFHDEGSLGFSDNSLSRYVYGLEHCAKWTVGGKLRVKGRKVEKHVLGDKTVPSSFFDLPGAENVSAIMFSNSGTNAKFARMGFQHGSGCESICMIRQGFAYDPDPDARDSSFFRYDLDCPPLVESWGQGLVILHNPKCLNPVPRGFFVQAVDHYIIEKPKRLMASEIRGWHPMTSHTLILHYGKTKQAIARPPIRTPAVSIVSIQKREFQSMVGLNHDHNLIFEEMGWYADDTRSFLGVLVWDKSDKDWGCIVLARNLIGRFCAVRTNVSLSTRELARNEIYDRIVELLRSPKRFFEQGNEQL